MKVYENMCVSVYVQNKTLINNTLAYIDCFFTSFHF